MSRFFLASSVQLPFFSPYIISILFALSVHAREWKRRDDLNLWIDREQVEKFGGFQIEIPVIDEGLVHANLIHANSANDFPTIPSEVSQVNFTWMAGSKRYFYNFDLKTLDPNVLEPPKISIKQKGKIPRKSKVFSIILPCKGDGVASFEVGLMIEMKKGKKREVLSGMPIKLKLKKECAAKGVSSAGPDPECDKMCAHGGRCNSEKMCVCTEGYMGQYCRIALCYPQCMNGGNCTEPGVCKCPIGYQGSHCEGGICTEKCLNGGKCVQKDTCKCPAGYFGKNCEHTKCLVPCLNGGKCKGTNKCRCPFGYQGDHCEIGRPRNSQSGLCRKPCRHGSCQSDGKCRCEPGWSGKICQHKLLAKRWDTT